MSIRLRRLLVRSTMIVGIALVCGAAYQWISERTEAGRYPPPGTLVDIGGRRLHVFCEGETRPGVPVVFFEPSAFGGAMSFRAARQTIASHTRVCSYDRAGTGWSDPGLPVQPPDVLERDLAALLEHAALTPPYVLVASSFGGRTAELFARRHPDRVAGLVFLDAANSEVLARFAPEITRTKIALACAAVRGSARLGILRLADPLHFRQQASASNAAKDIAQFYTVARMNALCAVGRGIPQGLEDFVDAPRLARDVPLKVLIAESAAGLLPPGLAFFQSSVDARRATWLESQQRFAAASSRGSWRIVPGSGHLIASTNPDVVAAEVIGLIAARSAEVADARSD